MPSRERSNFGVSEGFSRPRASVRRGHGRACLWLGTLPELIRSSYWLWAWTAPHAWHAAQTCRAFPSRRAPHARTHAARIRTLSSRNQGTRHIGSVRVATRASALGVGRAFSAYCRSSFSAFLPTSPARAIPPPPPPPPAAPPLLGAHPQRSASETPCNPAGGQPARSGA
eukprot:366178-Chlamydomonas_euryale.AAC.8